MILKVCPTPLDLEV